MRIIVKNERLSCHFRPMTKILTSGSHFFLYVFVGKRGGGITLHKMKYLQGVDDLCLLTTFHSHFLLDH